MKLSQYNIAPLYRAVYICTVMTKDELKDWRSRLKLSLEAASHKLGCSKTTLIAYERGRKIPNYIALACAAIAQGIPPIGG